MKVFIALGVLASAVASISIGYIVGTALGETLAHLLNLS